MNKIERESNFELLRIILIFMVLTLHFQNIFIHDFSTVTGGYIFLFGWLRSLSICAVNVFIILSGYFLCNNNKIQIRKVIDLFVYVLVFNLVNYFLTHAKWSGVKDFIFCLLPMNYYLWLYCALYVLHPLLNYGKENCKKIVIVLLILFSIIPTLEDTIFPNITDMSPITRWDGNGKGYTIVNFVLLYYIGMFLRDFVITKRKSITVFFISSLIITANFLLVGKDSAHNYCNIFVIISAVSIFAFFKELHIKSKVVNFVAKSVWGIYIWNSFAIQKLYEFTYLYKNMNYEFNSLLSISIMLIVILAGFCICVLLDNIQKVIIKIINLVLNKSKILNIQYNL